MSMDKKLNGFNNGRDTTEGTGGKPPYYEYNPKQMKDQQKDKAEEIIKENIFTVRLADGHYDVIAKNDTIKAMFEFAQWYHSQQNDKSTYCDCKVGKCEGKEVERCAFKNAQSQQNDGLPQQINSLGYMQNKTCDCNRKSQYTTSFICDGQCK